MVWVAHYQLYPSHQFEEPLGTVYSIDDLPQDRAVVRTPLRRALTTRASARR